MAEILLAEDEDNVRDGLKAALESNGHRVRAVADGVGAVDEFTRACPDLLLLDVMMPRMTGFEVCVHVRNSSKTVPVLLITAKADESDAVLGLGLGADDYLTKPVGMPVLLARVGVALRRVRHFAESVRQARERYRIGDGMLDMAARQFRDDVAGRVDLSALQARILALLAANPGRVFSREELVLTGWGGGRAGDLRIVDQQIAKLRRKLGRSGRLVETVSGCGYRLHDSCE